MARPSARDALAAADAVAREAGLPPAAMPPTVAAAATTPPPPLRAAAAVEGDEDLVQVNVRVRRALGDQLADRARAEGTTQKVLVCRALAAVGFDVHPDDLRASPAPRRRGAAAA